MKTLKNISQCLNAEHPKDSHSPPPTWAPANAAAFFRLLDENEKSGPDLLPETKDLGIMLYDMDFSSPDNITPMFFRAKMENGVIEVPPLNSNEILR